VIIGVSHGVRFALSMRTKYPTTIMEFSLTQALLMFMEMTYPIMNGRGSGSRIM
jgi:hypothetical protein